MKTLTTLITIIFISLLSSPGWSETVTKDDLVWRDLLFYKKFTDVPFTGKVTGQWSGTIKNGKREGLWTTYHENGQLRVRSIYKDGKNNDLHQEYYEDGVLWKTMMFKDNEYDGLHVVYYGNGQVRYQGQYEDGKQEGCWEFFHEDGSYKFNSLFKNDKRQGDCP